jgi:hypothetical protein
MPRKKFLPIKGSIKMAFIKERRLWPCVGLELLGMGLECGNDFIGIGRMDQG